MNTKLTLSTLAIALCACANSYAETIIPKASEPFRQDYIFSEAQRFEQNLKVTYFYSTRCGAYNTSVKSDFRMTLTRSWYKDNGVVKFTNAGNKKWAVDESYTWNGRKMYASQADIVNDTYDEDGQAPEAGTEGDGWELATACWNTLPTITNTMLGPKSTPAVVPPADTVSGTDSITGACGAGESGSKTVYRKFKHLTSGQKYPNFEFVATRYENNCVSLQPQILTQTAADSCPEGQIGRIDKSRTYSYFTDGTSKDFSDWTITGNSCVDVPKETVTPNHFEVTCDSYYGSAKGSYTGMVMKSGNNVTNAAGETTFNLISTDTTSCAKAFSDEKEVITEEACPAGQTGTRIMSVVTAENGSGTVYPNGSTPIEKSNTCVTPLDSGSVNNPESETQDATKSAVLSNMSFTVSQLSSDSDSNLLVSQMSKFDASKSDGSAHNFNIVANSLTSKTVNAANVTKVIKAYKAASGETGVNVKVGGLSQSLYDYVGQGGLTADKISSDKLVLLSSKEDSGVVTVKYVSYKNPMKPSEPESLSVKIYNQ